MTDEKKARRVIDFIQCLRHTKGEFHGKPFKLLPWQEKIIRDVFGTVREDDPTMRQYTTAYIEIPKKQGKSELGAAIALNMLVNDDEWKAEVYSCASDRQQAAIVFDVAVDMVKQSPALMKRIKIIPSMKRMVYQPTGSIYQVLSSEVATKHGLNVSACIFDELHTQPTRALYDVMTQGSGDARKQPLWFLLTTAGTDRNSICWEVHQRIPQMSMAAPISITMASRITRRTAWRLCTAASLTVSATVCSVSSPVILSGKVFSPLRMSRTVTPSCPASGSRSVMSG